MGGSGKTTLAKKIFNEKSGEYKGRCCFLADVRWEAAKNGLASLQSKLLHKLLHYDFKIDNSSQAKEILRDRLRNREILLVLDDVDEVEQMDALLVEGVIGERSMVIVTSRDKGVLTSCGLVLFHEMKGMGEAHAKELFCWHAFLLPDPPQGFEDLVHSFLIACSGLPLSLKVIGSLLHNKSIAFWNGTLEKIGKHILDKDITNTLKISYDGLDREKEIFLDIAWFFVGEEKSKLVRIWDGSGWSSLQSLERLEQKCLIEFVHERYVNRWEDQRLVVRMHDHLRDMGRSVIDNQTPAPTRLWRPQDIRSYLSGHQPGLIMEVRGICASPAPDLHASEIMARSVWAWKGCWLQVLEICGVSTMLRGGYPLQVAGSALRLLAAEGDSLLTEFSDFSKELLWLRWHDCPYTSIPSHFSMQKLRVLELFKGHFDSLWQSHKQAPTQLRQLSVHGNLKKLPESIGLLKHLEKIVLCRGSMETLPNELCNLKSLAHLDLSFCKLRSLPHGFGNLTNLRHLDLSCCRGLKALPDSFNQLIQLQYLSLFKCDSLMVSSDVLRNIRMLHYLDYTSITVETLPTHITSQRFLTNLNVWCPTLRELPIDIGELGNLKVLQVERTAVTSLPNSLEKLTLLRSMALMDCPNLSCIPESIGQLKMLQCLKLVATGVQSLPQGLVNLSNLGELFVDGGLVGDVILSTGDEETSTAGLSSKLHSYPNSHHSMSRLKSITLYYTKVVKLFISKNACPNLETLEVIGCYNLEEVKGLPITLVSVRLTKCYKLKRISGISNLTRLRYLNLCGCFDLHELEDLSQLTSLESIIADGCCALTQMDGLEYCLSLLKDIKIVACRSGLWKGIQCLKRLPSKLSSLTLGMKTVGGDEKEVKSILSSFMFPISVLEFPSCRDCKLGVEEVRSCATVVFVFFCENSAEEGSAIISLRTKYSYDVIVKLESECQWMILSVFTRHSVFLQNSSWRDYMDVNASLPFERNKGWLVLLGDGEEWKIEEIWEKLFSYAYSKQAP